MFERNAIFAGPNTLHNIVTLWACNIQAHSIKILFERLYTENLAHLLSVLKYQRQLFQHASIHMMRQEGSEFFPSTLVLRHCWQAKYSGIRKSGTPDLKSTRLVLRHCHNPRTGSCNAVAPSSATPPTQTLPKQMAPLPRLKAAMGRNLRPRLHSRYRDSWRRCPGWRLRCSRRWTESGISIPLGKQATTDLCGHG